MKTSIIKWTLVRTIGNSRLVGLTIAVPLIGYFILFNNQVLGQLELSDQVVGASVDPDRQRDGASIASRGLSNDTLFKLFMIYFGLCSLALGSVVYLARCPRTIKSYQNAVSYIAAEEPYVTDSVIGAIRRAVVRLGGGKFPVFDTIHEAIESEQARSNLTGQVDFTITNHRIDELRRQRKANVPNLLREHYRLLDQSDDLGRFTSLFFFALGFLLLSIPSAIMFWQVSSSFWAMLNK